jgi:hypothetical protein
LALDQAQAVVDQVPVLADRAERALSIRHKKRGVPAPRFCFVIEPGRRRADGLFRLCEAFCF